MQFDRVNFTTATAGTGLITVGAAVSGFMTPAQASVTNLASVVYFIKDGTAWESGYGVYTVSGTTMTRTLRDSSTGALLNLSGSATAFFSPGAADFNYLQPPYVPGRYYAPRGGNASTGNSLGSTITGMNLLPIRSRLRFTEVDFVIGTVAAAGNCKLGIFASSPTTMLPTGTALWDSGSILTTTNGLKSITSLNITLDAGYYWVGVQVDTTAAAVTFGTAGRNGPFFGDFVVLGSDQSNTFQYGTNGDFRKTGTVFGTWPTLTGSLSGDGADLGLDTFVLPTLSFLAA
jgi:hypothetical protein